MTEDADAPDRDPITVRLDTTEADVNEPGAVAAQIPLASTVLPGTRVVVLATATRRGGVLRRLLGPRREPVPRSTGCTALLARGYVRIGADAEASWGYAP